jgi:Holliday junction resolvase RusA-like endonuclease
MESKYYIVVTEWLYPNESGREVITDFDTKDEALVRCFELCDDELDNYWKNCGDYLTPGHFTNDDGSEGVIITAKNGLDEWFFQAKVIEVKFG